MATDISNENKITMEAVVHVQRAANSRHCLSIGMRVPPEPSYFTGLTSITPHDVTEGWLVKHNEHLEGKRIRITLEVIPDREEGA
jgi:transposase-like protein